MKARVWYPVLIASLMVAASVFANGRMPDRVATHFNFAGHPDRYGSKYTLLFLGPLLALFIGGLLLGIRALVVQADAGKQAAALYDRIVNVALTVFLGLHVSILARALGHSIALEHFAPAMIGLIFIAVGSMLPGIPRNPIIGVRTPWTLRSDYVWARSQRVGARLMVAAGLVSIAAAFLPTVAGFAVAIGAAIVVAITVTVYSYLVSKEERESSP